MFEPERMSVPEPLLVRPAEPVIAEEIVLDALLIVIVGVVPPREMVPPERTIAPEAEPKVRELALTVPETVIVPAASPSEEVPKFSASEVVVVVVPDMTLTPVAEVLHPWVELFVVGSAHVPCAVPNPALESLLSQ